MEQQRAERLEREMAYANKRDLESKAELILSGAIEITERGPMEFRPDVPEHAKGALLRGMRSVYRPSETKDDAMRKHRLAVQMGFLAPNVEVEYRDDGTYAPV